jgi:hypothetical protein
MQSRNGIFDVAVRSGGWLLVSGDVPGSAPEGKLVQFCLGAGRCFDAGAAILTKAAMANAA